MLIADLRLKEKTTWMKKPQHGGCPRMLKREHALGASGEAGRAQNRNVPGPAGCAAGPVHEAETGGGRIPDVRQRWAEAAGVGQPGNPTNNTFRQIAVTPLVFITVNVRWKDKKRQRFDCFVY